MLVRTCVIVDFLSDEHSFARRNDLDLVESDSCGAGARLFEDRVRSRIVAEHQVGCGEHEECQGPPLAVFRETHDGRSGVGEHDVDSATAHRRSQRGDLRIQGGVLVATAFTCGEPTLRVGRESAQRMDARAFQCQGGMAIEHRSLLELLEPHGDRRATTAAIRGKRDLHEYARRVVLLADLERVFERRLRITVQLEPLRGPPPQDRDEIGLGLEQLPAQQILEEVVVPVPLAVGVERDEEEVRASDRVQLVCRVLPVERRIA